VIKEKIATVCGLIGGGISYLIGGWTGTTSTLLIFMVVDYLTGFALSAIFKKSIKTETGGLSSKIGFQGLVKKCLILVFLLIAYRLDLLLNVNYIRDGVCYGFIVNELLSIIENCGLMGFTVPSIISNAIDVLKSKEDSKN
jgi:toxin secretion/phage lysis holin